MNPILALTREGQPRPEDRSAVLATHLPRGNPRGHYPLATVFLIYSYAIRNRRKSLKTLGRHHV